MRIKFYLKRPDASALTVIYALVSYGTSKPIKIYTEETIDPKFWNPKSQTARSTPKFPEAPEFNQRLVNIKASINAAFLDYKNRHNHETPSPSALKSIIEKSLRRSPEMYTFLSFFKEFATKTSAGARIDPRTKKSIKGTGGRGYITTLNHLEEFNKTWKPKVSFSTIGLEFYEEFTDYLKGTPHLLSLNTIGSHIQRIKAVMGEALDKKLTANTDFRSKRFVKVSEDADTIYLNTAELKALRDHDLTNSPRLEKVRDLFLVGCFTGLRFSDFSILQPENIKDGFISITQTKTKVPVIIPVHKEVGRIMGKYENNLPRSISNEKMNAYLKEIGQQIECLKRMEQKHITKGGTNTISTVPKWQLLTTHTARRSFATNEYKAGTPTLTIMAITGHKTEKAFLKYIRVTPEEHAQKLKILWDKRETKLKAV